VKVLISIFRQRVVNPWVCLWRGHEYHYLLTAMMSDLAICVHCGKPVAYRWDGVSHRRLTRFTREEARSVHIRRIPNQPSYYDMGAPAYYALLARLWV
jgi:hypothetical protein